MDTGKQNILLPDKSNRIMLLDTGKQNILLPDESNRIMFSYTGKQNVLLPYESNKIMFSDTGKQNVLLSDKNNKIMFSDTRTQNVLLPVESNGLFQKISTTPLWMTLNWVLKTFRISKNDSSSFCRIPNLTGSKSWGIPEFYFEWFSWNSGQNSQNFGEIHGFPVMLTKHFLQDSVHGWCVGIL